MKALFKILTFLFLFATANATEWGGTYNTNFGEVKLVQKGNLIVGTYADKGHVLVHTITGNTVEGIFFNNNKLGDFKWTKNGSKITGKWAWKGDPLIENWSGEAVRTTSFEKYEGIWETTYGNIQFIQNKHNMMAGTYGANGFIYGKYNPTTKILRGTYSNEGNGNFKPFQMKFNGYSFTGKFEERDWGSWNGSKKSRYAKIVVKLQTLKLYKSNGVGGAEKGKVNIFAKIFDSPINKIDTYLLHSTQNIVLSEGQSKDYANTEIEFPVLIYKNKLVEAEDLSLQFQYNEYRRVNNALDTYQADTVDLQEITRFLTGDKPLSSYANGPDGRKRLANSTHTFWLKEYPSNNSRNVRGYGFVNFNEKQKWGYFYTVALKPL
ncbi:hypothetical protein [uncultured Dokdonia sp.]|uniref:hypothetical protein n=1 Tax=uncultured Dokdonia sp. TaxID=575653 RepID=UPI00261031EA|nr:hypothetical protein [uncultured Dokdonia sp.]